MLVKPKHYPLQIKISERDESKQGMGCYLKFKDLEIELRKKMEMPESSYVSGYTVKEDGIIFLFEEGSDEL